MHLLGKQLDLWRKITSSNHPQHLVKHDLQTSLEGISKGILCYDKARSERSVQELKAKRYGENQTKFVLELSELLDVDELICQELFTAWLVVEYRESPDQLQTCLSDERSRYGLLSRLVSFYYTDRIYSHLTFKHLLSQSHNPQHPFQAVYSEFLHSLGTKASGRIYKLLVAEYESLYNKEPLELYDSPLRHVLTEEHQSAWCYQILKEQVIVLEKLLIHLYYKPCTDYTYLHDLVSKFKTRALTGQAHTAIKHLIADIHRPLITRLEQLQVLIILVSMKLKNTRTVEENEQILPTMQKLDSMFGTRLGEFQSHSPLILGWAVTRCGQVAPELIGRLGDAALGLNVFSYILGLLNSLEPQEISNQLSVITIYYLVTKVIALFDDSALGDDSLITQIICQLLKHQSVSDIVIQAGESDAVYRYVLSSLHAFPLNFHPPLNLLAAMSSSSKAAAAHVVRLLLSIPTFTEYLDISSQTNMRFLTDNEVELLDHKPMFGDVVLPAGTVGVTADLEGPPTVQWYHAFNAWDLLACELTAVCAQPHLVNDVNVQQRLLSNTRLMSATFSHASISGSASDLVHDSLYRIIYGLASLECPPTEILSSCLDLTASLASFTPTRVLENLSVVYLPFALNSSNDIKRPWETEIERSLLGHVLYSAECTQSSYPVLISTLKLICRILMTSQSHDLLIRERLVPVVLYILREVLTSFNGWRYSDVTERDAIGELCTEMIHSILNTSDSKTDDILTEPCIQTLLHTNSGQVILNMISLGAEILDLVMLEQASLQVTSCLSRAGRPSTVYRLGLCLSLLRRLLIIAHGTKGGTILESNLSSKGSQSQRHITRVIASYTYHRHHTRLAILSTQLLTVIAQESQMSIMSSFGEDVYSIRSGFLRRLALRSEDPRFKVVLVELLTTCVENQPGLLELFLSTNTDEEPLLTTIQAMIESDRQFTHICPGDLLLAGLNFVLALWSAGRERVTQKLATSESFWKTVVTPLSKRIGDLSSGSTSHPLKAKIFCNVLQLLAYQLYQRDAKLKEFTSVLSSLTQAHWTDISAFLHSELRAIHDDNNSELVAGRGDETLRHSAAVHLLDSYRMFLSTIQLAKASLFQADTCNAIMSDVLNTLTHITTGEITSTYHRLASMLSSMLFELVTKWHSKLKDWESSYRQLAHILHASTNGGSDMQLLPNTLIGIVASLQLLTTQKLKTQKSRESTTDSTQSVLACLCNLLPALCSKISTTTASSSGAGDSQIGNSATDTPTLEKLRLVLLSTLFELIDKLPESLWLSKLHESYIIPSLLTSLAHSIKTRTDLLYVESCIALLTDLSTKPSPAKLVTVSLADHLTLTVSSLYASNGPITTSNKNTTGGDKSGVMASSGSWQKVMSQVIDVYSFLLSTLAHGFVADAATFVAVHSDQILTLIELFSTTLNTENMSELRSYVHLLACLSKHQHQWMTEMNCLRVKQLLVGVCYLSQDCVALLHRPKAIQLMLVKQVRSKKKGVENPENIDISHTRHGLLDILSECCLVMKCFTPDLCLLLNDVTLDVMSYEPLVLYGFTSPTLENRAPPTFGSFISTISFCISLLTKSERSPSRSQLSDEEVDIIRPRLLYVLDITLYLILSQVMLYLRAGALGQKEINVLKREIGTELNGCILGIQRYHRKSTPASPRGSVAPSSSASSSAPTFPSNVSAKSPRARGMLSPAFSSNTAELGLYKLVDQFVKKILK